MKVPRKNQKDKFRQGHQNKYVQHKDKLCTGPASDAYREGHAKINWKKKGIANVKINT